MVVVRIDLDNGVQVAIVSFIEMPRIGELVVLQNVGTYRVKDVHHMAGDPRDNNPPAWSVLVVQPVT